MHSQPSPSRRALSPHIALLLCLTLILAGCSGNNSSDYEGQVNERYSLESYEVVVDEETGEHYVSGIVLVYFEPSASQQQRNDAVELVGGKLVGQMDAYDEYQIEVSAQGHDQLDDIIRRLEEAPGVDFARLDTVTYMDQVETNDPWEGSGVRDTDGSWWSLAVDAPRAWDSYGGVDMADVPVGVLDNGFDMEHEDLAGRLVWASNNDVANRDEKDHGTHVAGIIAAQPNNGKGIAGLNWRGNVLCYDVAAIDAGMGSGITHSSLEDGTRECVRSGAKVVNMSIGSSGSYDAIEWPQYQKLVDRDGKTYSRIIGALLSEGYDFVVVQAAGNGDTIQSGIDARYNLHYASITNENCDTSYASYADIIDRVLIVAAAEPSDDGYRLTSFSNGGPQVSVCAPGVSVYSTVTGNGYGEKSGTSMATPIVSGIAALVWSANPELDGRDVKQIVSGSAYTFASPYPGGNYPQSNYPMVNAEKALTMALERRGTMLEQPSEQPSEVSNEEARAAYEQWLRSIADAGEPLAAGGNIALHNTDGSEEVYYRFGVVDVDGDGSEELFCSHETLEKSYDSDGSSGYTYVSASGCLNDVYTYTPDAGLVLQWRSTTSFVPNEVTFYGNGFIRLDSASIDWDLDERVYMPANAESAEAFGIQDGTGCIHMYRQDGGWQVVIGENLYYDSISTLTDAEGDLMISQIEGDGALDVETYTMLISWIDAISDN